MQHSTDHPRPGRRRSRRAATSALLSLLALVGGVGSAAARTQERGTDLVAERLLEGRRAAATPEELERGLARGGLPDVRRLFELLERGRFEVRVGEHGNATKALTPAERVALLALLGRHPWPALQRFLADLLARGPSESGRLTALAVLEAHGSGPDLPLLMACVAPARSAGADARVARPLRAGFDSALAGILQRDPAALEAVGALYATAPAALLPSIARALGERPSPASLRVLGELLGRMPAADALVLAEIGHVAGLVREPVDARIGERVRAYLIHGRGPVLSEAIVACGRLEDFAAVPPLIGLLEAGDANAARLAHAALERVTGRSAPFDPEAWARWHRSALQWQQVEAPAALEAVRAGRAEEAARAILELSKRRHLRHELTPRLALGLEREEAELVLLTCAALGHLGSTLAVKSLLVSLEDERVAVRRAAYLALCRVTGEDHGEQSREWVAAGW